MESEPSTQTFMFRVRPSPPLLIQREWKCSCTDTRRSSTKRFCWWIVVCFMCAHDNSYVYSHVCAKAPCLDDNLVRRLDSNPYFWDLITKMMLQDRERDDNSFANASACHGPVGALLKAIGVLRLWSVFTKFVWWCAAHCAKSHKDRVVLVFHELVSTCSYT
jgi:hypothetical protein